MKQDAMQRLAHENPVPGTLPPPPIEPLLRQLSEETPEQAAQTRSLPRRGLGARTGVIAPALSVAVAISVAAGALILIGHHRGSARINVPNAQRHNEPLPRHFVDRSTGVSVRYPAGWHIDQRPLTRTVSPQQLLAVSSFPLRQPHPDPNCTPTTALKELPPNGALLILLEQANAGDLSSSVFSRRPAQFHLETQPAQPRECFGVSREITFEDAGRDIYAIAYFGPKASLGSKRLVDRVLESLKLSKRKPSGG